MPSTLCVVPGSEKVIEAPVAVAVAARERTTVLPVILTMSGASSPAALPGIPEPEASIPVLRFATDETLERVGEPFEVLAVTVGPVFVPAARCHSQEFIWCPSLDTPRTVP